jgi:hypothetical protein
VVSADGDYGYIEDWELRVVEQPIYTLSVAGARNYHVGQGQWLVHNDCPEYSITNIPKDPKIRNQRVLNAIQPGDGSGWTGAYDMDTNSFVAIPSDPSATFLRPPKPDPNSATPPTTQNDSLQNPPGTVQRQGGHGTAANILRQELGIEYMGWTDRFIGFHLSYPEENTLQIGWKSNAINGYPSNPYTEKRHVLSKYHKLIMSHITESLPDGVSLTNLGNEP